MKVWLNGTLVERNDARISVYDHGVLYGDGVFEGIRVYDAKPFQCAAHLDRLFRSADKVRLKIPYSKQDLIDAMDMSIRANGQKDGYIRLVVTRGEGNLGLHPFHCARPNVFVIADQIALYPPELYETGLPVIVAQTRRCGANMLDPSAKSLNYLNNILAKIESIDAGVSEAIMLNEQGNVAEATGDNVFLVRGGRILTPPPQAGILLGVTRGVVLHLARRLGLPTAEENFTPEDLYKADECFLTGTAAEVIPVTKIDGRPIGDGRVGPITRKLLDAFHQFIRTDEQVPYQG